MSICATTRRARMAELWYHGGGCRSWLRVVRDTRNHDIQSVALGDGRGRAAADGARSESKRAVPARCRRRHRPGASALLQLRRQGAIPATLATRLPRRCSPMASTWSAARSNITGRAASSAPAPRSRTRWSSCGPARGASRTRAPPWSSSTMGSTPRARTAGRRSKFDLQSINSLMSPFCRRGFYYKTFMWPANFWERVYEPIDPKERRARPRRD